VLHVRPADGLDHRVDHLLRPPADPDGVRWKRREDEERGLRPAQRVRHVVRAREVRLGDVGAPLLPALGLVRITDQHPELAATVQKGLGDHRTHVPGHAGDDVLGHESLLA
jgi:hypothetical protein